MITTEAGTLEVSGARLYYELRGSGPLIALVGSPMGSGPFGPMADLLASRHTVLTMDPRGIGRSPVDDPVQDSTPELRADDLARLLTHIDAGPAAIMGSSGGAVTALALAQARPEMTGTVVAHEPPLVELLPDRERLHAGTADMVTTYKAGDVVGAWKKFLAQANIALPDPLVEQIWGGERDPQEVADGYRGFVHEMPATTRWRPDVDLLRKSGVRFVVGIGEDSAGQLCDRASRALCAALGTEPAIFPGDHTGFAEKPDPFAARLRSVLAG